MDDDVRPAPSPAHGQDAIREPSSKLSSTPKRTYGATPTPAVISSIISSLETDTLTPLPDSSDFYSDIASRRASHTRNKSSDRSISSNTSAQLVPSSPGFGVEYGRGLALDDEDGLSDAALPPNVPTSRPASGLSNYIATSPRHSSFPAKPKSRPRPASINTRRTLPTSRRSSLSAVSVRSPRSNLYEESGPRKKSSAGEEALEKVHDWIAGKGQEPASDSQLAIPTDIPSTRIGGPQSLSLAEQIIARSNGQLSSTTSRRQQADANAHITKEQLLDLLPVPSLSPQPSPTSERRPSATSSTSGAAQRNNNKHPRPPSGTASLIADSVPTRTSSLRHSVSPAPKRKSKKTRRVAMATSATSYKSSDVIPDSKWEDLGDEDETVKRIRELREQRKSRLHETPPNFDPPAESSFENFAVKDVHVAELAAELPSNFTRQASPRQASPSRPPPNRSKSERVLEKNVTPLKESKGAQTSGAKTRAITPQSDRRMPKYSLDSKRPMSAQNSPTSSDFSSLQPLSLDYSYNEAVDVLRGVEHRDLNDPGNRSENSSPLWLQGLDLPTSPKHISPIGTPTNRKSVKLKKAPKPPGGLQSDRTPELTKKKSRRKSMGDARSTPALGDMPPMPRRDSVEEAVVAFLAAPRLNKKLKHPVTGRVIAFSEVGDPKGAAVFVCVGMGLTRYVTAFYDELAATLRLRLITLDRPGVGGSEPYPSSDKTGPLGWAEDVFAICEHLRISKFSLLAHSAGAVYALATALVYPHFIKGKVHLLAPWVPPSQLEAISHAEPAPPSNPLPRSQRFLRVIPAPFLKAANTSFMTATSASLKPVSKRKNYSNMKTPPPRRAPEVPWNQRPTSGDKPEYNRRESMMLMDQYMPETTPLEAWPLDMSGENGYSPAIRNGSLVLSATAIPTDPSFNYATSGLNAAEHAESQRQSEYTSRLTQRTWDLATRDSNPATDLLVCLERHRDVGFRYTDVGRDMIITHGSDDKRVPIANVKWLAEQINRRALALKADPGARELRRNSWAEMQSKTRCEVRVLPGEGHGLMASPSIMSDVLEEIAGYWRGHDRARER